MTSQLPEPTAGPEFDHQIEPSIVVSLATLMASPSACLTDEVNGRLLATTAKLRSASASATFRLPEIDLRSRRIEVLITVLEGELYVGWKEDASQNMVVGRTAGFGEYNLDIIVPAGTRPGALIFQNANSAGASRAVIERIAVLPSQPAHPSAVVAIRVQSDGLLIGQFEHFATEIYSYGAAPARLWQRGTQWLFDSQSERDWVATPALRFPTERSRFWKVTLTATWPDADDPRCALLVSDDSYRLVADAEESAGYDRSNSEFLRVMFVSGNIGTFALPQSVVVNISPDPDFDAPIRSLIDRVEKSACEFEYVSRLRDALFSDLVVCSSYPSFYIDHVLPVDGSMGRGIRWGLKAYETMQKREAGVLCLGAAEIFADILWTLGIPAYPICFAAGAASHAATVVFCRARGDVGELIPVLHDVYFNYELAVSSLDGHRSQQSDFSAVLDAFEQGHGDEVAVVPGPTTLCECIEAPCAGAEEPRVSLQDHSVGKFTSRFPWAGRQLLAQITGYNDIKYIVTITYTADPIFSPAAIKKIVHAYAQLAHRRLRQLRGTET